MLQPLRQAPYMSLAVQFMDPRYPDKRAVLNLYRVDRPDFASPAQAFRRTLAETEIFNFARFDNFSHCCDHSFDGNLAVETVTIPEIDLTDL